MNGTLEEVKFKAPVKVRAPKNKEVKLTINSAKLQAEALGIVAETPVRSRMLETHRRQSKFAGIAEFLAQHIGQSYRVATYEKKGSAYQVKRSADKGLSAWADRGTFRAQVAHLTDEQIEANPELADTPWAVYVTCVKAPRHK